MSQTSALDHLRAVDLLRDFDDTSLQAVATAAQRRQYRALQTIFLRGDPADGMFIVADGVVRLSITTAEGRELTLRHVSAGTAFGEIAMLDGGPRSADATALQPSALLFIARSHFQAIIKTRPDLANGIIRRLCAQLRRTTDQLEAIALMPLERRLARLFLSFARAAGASSGRIDLPLELSQSELASLIAASRPKVNQILVAWNTAAVASHTPAGLALNIDALQLIADGLGDA
jgi:CRP-like cAMP-binding protein